MKHSIFPLTLILLTMSSCYSQKQNILLQNYSTYKEILYEKESKGGQYASWKLSRIGEYDEAKQLFEETKNYSFDSGIKPFNFKLTNSVNFIDSISKHEQAIFINEAHHISQHRNFIRRILPALYKNGYRHLGMEAFNSKDSLINERGYPIKESGFYTKDPEYGELIRDAINLGFTIFGYETSKGKNGKEREIEQAKNIISKTIQKDKNAKILIIAGFDHIREDTLFRSWGKAMAGRFYEYSGINPITIDQVQFTPQFYEKNTNPLLKNKTFNISSTPLNSFKNPYSEKGFDFYIFHPHFKLKQSIKEWKYSFDRFPLYVHKEFIKPNENYLILAYDFNEYQNEKSTNRLIPKDIVSIKQKNRPLVLKQGKYFIEIINAKKEVIYSTTITHKLK